ncbi:hypothetical protein ACETK8_19420 [Brevundimonas staleyi]|uniref:Uncharacterized protein n=1 Tax=Brevundimonas staleyi TaxID=74326 RepID=A0ABW0FRH4_9CAUL
MTSDAPTPKAPAITLMQSADAFRYAEMLAATARTVRTYAEARGYAYEQFQGTKYGVHPWHACFNRIFMLAEMVERGVTGWVCHMDADAWINDLSFDLAGFLADKQDAAAVFTPSGSSDEWWDVNDGVFLINLDSPAARRLIADWKAATLQAWPQIAHHSNFPPGGPDDQSLLHILLAEGDYRAHVRLDDGRVMNTPDARFIRQHLRSLSATFAIRLGRIREAVNAVLSSHTVHGTDDLARAMQTVEGLYLGILNRPADQGIDNPYVRTILDSGLRDGVELVAGYLIDSGEFQSSSRGAG